MTPANLRNVVLGAVCALLLVPTLGATSAVAATMAHPARSHRVHRTHHPRPDHGGIPQRNGGDHDSDNNGAPSDGDGNQ